MRRLFFNCTLKPPLAELTTEALAGTVISAARALAGNPFTQAGGVTHTATRNAFDGAVGGALAGGMATLTMTAAMFAAKAAGLMGEMPPEKIAANALEKVGLSDHHVLQDVVASTLHIAFGAGAGALYGALDEGVALPGPALLKGVGFGTAIWTVSYAGWVPALGIMAMPDKDRHGRPQSMLAAHWVYGAALTIILSRLHRGKPSAGPARSET